MQRENKFLHEEIKELIEENRRLSSDEKSTSDREQSGLLKYKKCTDDVIQNLNGQISSLNEVIKIEKTGRLRSNMILFFDPGELNVQATVDNWPAHDRLFGAGNIRLPQTMQQSEFNCSIESRM